MAVRIDIPNIGIVEADNAAQEDTLKKLLVEMQKMSGSRRPTTATNQGQGFERLSEAGEELADELEDNAVIAKKSGVGWAGAAMAMSNSMRNLGATAVNVAKQLLTNYDAIADDPVSAGRDIINTGIELIADFSAGLLGAIPIVGGFLSALAEATGKILQTANNLFAQELKKRIDAMADFNKAGVSFAGGIDEMGKVANEAGMGIKDFTGVVKNAKQDLNFLGVAGAEAAKRLGDGMSLTSKLIGRSGKTLREELFSMGYSFEEQGEVMAGFMANMAASGKLRQMSDTEIAQGTREYAKNLKVITDITGQDAKKLMEQARAESMRGALMARLTGEQKDAFQKAHATMGALGPEFQNALTQMLSGGTVTDPIIAGNQQAMAMIQETVRGVQSGSKDIIGITQNSMATAAEQQRKLGQSATDVAGLLSMGGATTATGFAKIENALLSYQGKLGQAEESAKMTDLQAAAGGTTESVTALYKATKDQQIFMETMIGEKLPQYTKILEQTTNAMVDVMNKAIRLASGEDVKEVLGVKEKDWTKILGGGALALGGAALTYFTAGLGGAIGGGAAMGTGAAMIAQGWNADKQENTATPKGIGKAKGGISSGPLTGYQEILHGTEAVVPLPDGKKIPVDIRSPMPSADDIKQAIKDGVRDAMSESNQSIFSNMTSELRRQTNKLGGILNNTF